MTMLRVGLSRPKAVSIMFVNDEPPHLGGTALSSLLIQQTVPVVPLVGFVTQILNQSLHIRNRHAESCSSLRNHIFFDHDASQVIGPTFKGDLPNFLALRHPGTLNI